MRLSGLGPRLPKPNNPSKVSNSDSALTKGIIALLLGLSEELLKIVIGVLSEFEQLLRLRQSLSPLRNNGFLNMLKLMQQNATKVGGLGLNDKDRGLKEEGDDLGGKNSGFEENLKIDEVSIVNGEEIKENVILKEEIG